MELEIYDTTLRDGSQQEGISLTVGDKLRIASLLDDLGVHYIEGGWPGANPKDDEFFSRAGNELKLANAILVALGSTRRAGRVLAVSESIEHPRRHDRRVFFDAEHFFDGFYRGRDFAMAIARAAAQAG